mmetsp:Transcript_8459/g.13388  ORF Transcript_8459/g.13388 Transcript_8459/m.13388 type:complete len:92 (+) Transcript_8459:153-428(+)
MRFTRKRLFVQILRFLNFAGWAGRRGNGWTAVDKETNIKQPRTCQHGVVHFWHRPQQTSEKDSNRNRAASRNSSLILLVAAETLITFQKRK